MVKLYSIVGREQGGASLRHGGSPVARKTKRPVSRTSNIQIFRADPPIEPELVDLSFSADGLLEARFQVALAGSTTRSSPPTDTDFVVPSSLASKLNPFWTRTHPASRRETTRASTAPRANRPSWRPSPPARTRPVPCGRSADKVRNSNALEADQDKQEAPDRRDQPRAIGSPCTL